MLFLLRGVEVAPEAVEWLCSRVDEPTATTLREALYGVHGSVHLGADDQERILEVLERTDEVPDGLDSLRVLLLIEREQRPGPA